jgi:5,10-methylenetetrahydromethanopterin reductase
MELWTVRIPETGTVEAAAERAEAAGWDGVAFTDSQNLVGDPFVASTLGARVTDRLRFATGVTNVATRDPAALATVAATVQEASGGRFVLGLGRGDTALFHLGRKPQPVSAFVERAGQLHAYLGGETVDRDGFASRLRWLDRATQPRVPLDVAASGPKVIGFAAATAERVTFAVGADPDRMAWALGVAREAMVAAGRAEDDVSFGAYVNIGCHPDVGTARSLIGGSVAAFAHFSSMPGSTGAGLAERDRGIVAEVGRAYDSNLHLVNSAPHTGALDADFVDRFAVVGGADECIRRLQELAGLGLERFVLTGASFGADRAEAKRSGDLLVREVLPALRSG